MRKHEEDSRFVILDDIEEARQFRTKGWGWLKDRTTNIIGAVHTSPALQSIAASFTYASSSNLPIDETERKFQKGRFSFRGDGEEIKQLNHIAREVGHYLEPLFGPVMHMGLYDRSPGRHGLHTHPGMTTAVLPLGSNQLSTVWKNLDGQILQAPHDSLVVIGEEVEHGSPVIDHNQIVMTISSYHRSMR